MTWHLFQRQRPQPNVTQVITVYENGEQRGLLDGQHRVGALKMLAEADVLMPAAHLILVEVFPAAREEDVKR